MTQQLPQPEKLPPLERVRIDQVVYVRVKVHMPAADASGKPALMGIAVDRWGKEHPDSLICVPEHLVVTQDEARKAVQR
jgi:hypothetical protein